MVIFAVRGNGESENRWKFGLACIYGIKGNINIELYEFLTIYFVTIFAYIDEKECNYFQNIRFKLDGHLRILTSFSFP